MDRRGVIGALLLMAVYICCMDYRGGRALPLGLLGVPAEGGELPVVLPRAARCHSPCTNCGLPSVVNGPKHPRTWASSTVLVVARWTSSRSPTCDSCGTFANVLSAAQQPQMQLQMQQPQMQQPQMQQPQMQQPQIMQPQMQRPAQMIRFMPNAKCDVELPYGPPMAPLWHTWHMADLGGVERVPPPPVLVVDLRTRP